MRRGHVQGVVKLKIWVSDKGDVQSVSGDRRLAAAAIEAVKQWKYDPFLLNGEPMGFTTTVDINFSLAGG